MIFTIVNIWLTIALLHFAVTQMHTKTFTKASKFYRGLWFVVIFFSMSVLTETGFQLDFLPFHRLCKFFGIEIIHLRTATMGLWLTVYGVIHSIYKNK